MQELNIINFNFWIIIKIFFLLALALYIVFAFVITKQVKVMTETITLGFEPIAKFLALFHLCFSILVFIVALVVL